MSLCIVSFGESFSTVAVFSSVHAESDITANRAVYLNSIRINYRSGELNADEKSCEMREDKRMKTSDKNKYCDTNKKTTLGVVYCLATSRF